MNVACDYEAPMQMLTTEKYIAARSIFVSHATPGVYASDMPDIVFCQSRLHPG